MALRLLPWLLPLILSVAAPVTAETLPETLARTYAISPTLKNARAQLRGLEESVAIARAPGLPTLAATGRFTQDFRLIHYDDAGRSVVAGFDLDQSLYSGGSVRNGIAAARARVLAGRSALRQIEGGILRDAVIAYLDVRRDREVVELVRNQVSVLEADLEANRTRADKGDLTKTDVDQSSARLSLARARLAGAQARLETSAETFRRISGVLPADLDTPPPLPALPPSPDAAAAIALADNGDLQAARAQADAAALDVRVERAVRLPTLSLIAGASYTDYLGTLDRAAGLTGRGFNLRDRQSEAHVGLSLRVPFYQGGVAARIRQREANEAVAIEQATATERQLVAEVRSAYADVLAAREAVNSGRAAVVANEGAVKGVRLENNAGFRTTLEVLNAEQELLVSRVELQTARRDEYAAAYRLLAIMGKADGSSLGLDGGALFDPVAVRGLAAGAVLLPYDMTALLVAADMRYDIAALVADDGVEQRPPHPI